MRRKARKLDPILLEEASTDDEWIMEEEDPCLPDDLTWLDGDDGDIEHLDVAAISNLATGEETLEDVLHTKKQRVNDSSSSVQRGKEVATEDVPAEDYDPEDANIILEEDDLVF
ncbi:uncharacterized protein A4U43_C01F19410 [Asparagus officinalis]|uniref:Uncharacterized protein n=1 Tax=Asparagus officinalis TaxID=4686 RepID=A0A5P1FQU9_ASPOF|nr:uncharacterized protein A4U43_C01F19410 [Asparagus officinalis]